MLYKKIIYTYTAKNNSIYFVSDSIENMLAKIQKELDFWKAALNNSKDEDANRVYKKLIKDYETAFSKVFNHKEL